jgi:hypothetical protein
VIRALLALALAATACSDVDVVAISNPPPGRTATLDGDDEMRLSRGVALAFQCLGQDDDDSYRGPCRSPRVVSADGAIVSVRPAYLERLVDTTEWDDANPENGARPMAAWVAVGLAEGQTTISVDAEEGSLTIDVRVLP